MNLIKVSDGVKSGKIPIALNTVYKWSVSDKFPGLIKKVGQLLFWDMDLWDSMVVEKQGYALASNNGNGAPNPTGKNQYTGDYMTAKTERTLVLLEALIPPVKAVQKEFDSFSQSVRSGDKKSVKDYSISLRSKIFMYFTIAEMLQEAIGYVDEIVDLVNKER